MPFKPGQSGNPGGRPKELAGIRELARANAPLAIQTLVDIAASGKSEAARVAAANHLLDRGFGKPGTADQVNPHDNRDVGQLTDDQLMEIIEGRVVVLEHEVA